MVTIKDIAKSTNCSPTTVSFIINNHPLAAKISKKTKKKVQNAIRELDYIPNVYAKTLRQGSQQNIGILCFDIMDPYSTMILNGIQHYLNNKNYFYQLADVQNDVILLNNFFQMVKSHKLAAIIGIVNSLTMDPADLIKILDNDTIFVAIGREIPSLRQPSILLDHYEGTMLGVEHLYNLGHREIAFIRGPEKIEDSRIRWQAFVDACKKYDIPYRDEWVVTLTDYPATSESGVAAIRQLLNRRRTFTAVIAFDDYTAFDIIQEMTRSGISVPKDVSIVGFDDIWISKAYNPALTTIRQPMMEMGQVGTQLAIDAITRPKERVNAIPNQIVFRPELVVRESTAPLQRRPTDSIRRKSRTSH